MTEENRAVHVMAELARGEQSLRAAQELLRLGLASDAVSRAYYAALHFVLALLLTEGVEPRTHRGAGAMLSLHFIVPARLSPERAKEFARLEQFRTEADYNRFFVFTLEGATEEVEVAERFCEAARAWLLSNGWTKSASPAK
ncbi:MAG TPA: HEPN domain-containing protein [Polyangiaceae bacterium]|nr:HEPN domain-containing protein [Polyangiaceae bacterium]